MHWFRASVYLLVDSEFLGPGPCLEVRCEDLEWAGAWPVLAYLILSTSLPERDD